LEKVDAGFWLDGRLHPMLKKYGSRKKSN